MGTSGTVNNAFLAGLLGGVGNQMMTHEERQYKQKLQDLQLKREVLAALSSDKTASPQAQALALQGLLSSSEQPKAKGVRGKLGQKSGQSPLDEIIGQIKGMPAQTQPAKPPIQVPGIPDAPPPQMQAQAQSQGKPMSEVPPMPIPGMAGSPPLTPPKLSMTGAPPQMPQMLPGMPEVPGLKIAPSQAPNSDPVFLRELALLQAREQMRAARPTTPAKSESESLTELHKAQAEMDRSRAELLKAQTEFEASKSDLDSPQFKLAYAKLEATKQRAAQTQQRLALSTRREGLSEEQQKFREQGPTGTTRSKAQQASVVKDQGEQLINWIDQHPEAFGIQFATLSEAAQSRNPLVAEAATKVKSFAALQPALHGSRGIGMQKEFEGAVGKLWSQPAVLKQRIRALMNTAESFEQEGQWPHKQAPSMPSAPGHASSTHKVGDVVTYKGKHMKVSGITPEGKLELEPAQ